MTAPATLEPEELRVIVDAWGGTEKFAAVIHAKPRTVKAWLLKERSIRPQVALLIQQLGKPPKKN